MFTKIWNWFKGLFADAMTAELVVKAAAARAFKEHQAFAYKAYKIAEDGITSINAGTADSLFILNSKINEELMRTNLLPEEKALASVLIGSVKEQIATNTIGKDMPDAEQLRLAKQYLTWIRDMAILYKN